MEAFIGMIVFGLLCYGGFMLWLAIYRPEIYQAHQQRKHERRLAAEEAKRKAAAGSILSGIASAVLNAAIKNRPH